MSKATMNYKKQDPDRWRRYRQRHWQQIREKQIPENKRYRRVLKTTIINKYGGKCECCKENRMEFLTIEHKKGRGRAHRKKVGVGNVFYNWLNKQRIDKVRFGVLCANCNLSLGIYGYCPHKTKRSVF